MLGQGSWCKVQHQKWYPWPYSCSPAQKSPSKIQLLVARQEVLRDFLDDWSEHQRRKRSITPGTHSDSSGFSTRSIHERKKSRMTAEIMDTLAVVKEALRSAKMLDGIMIFAKPSAFLFSRRTGSRMVHMRSICKYQSRAGSAPPRFLEFLTALSPTPVRPESSSRFSCREKGVAFCYSPSIVHTYIASSITKPPQTHHHQKNGGGPAPQNQGRILLIVTRLAHLTILATLKKICSLSLSLFILSKKKKKLDGISLVGSRCFGF